MLIQMFAFGLAIGVSVGTTASAAELRLLAPLAVKGVVGHVIPEFEKLNDVNVVIEAATLPQVAQKASSGAAFDVVIAPAATIDKLRVDGIVAEFTKLFGVAHISVAYRKGSPVPKVATLDEVRETIRSAKAIGTTDGGTTAVYFVNVAKQLGLEDELKRKTVLGPSGQGALPVAEGKAEIGVSQSSEIADLKTLESVKMLPSDPKSQTRFMISAATKAGDPALAKRFVEYVASKETERQRIEGGFSVD